MTVVVASDLDRTLIYSASAAGSRDPELVCVELLDGRPQSFMTATAHAVLDRVRRAAVLVPTTTRTPSQYARVEQPGGPAPFAVVSNGGHILVDGVPDAGWRAAVQARIAAGGTTLAQVWQARSPKDGALPVPQHLGAIRQPTLIIWGAADPVFPAADAGRLAASLPNATSRVVPGAGHLPHEEAEPEVTAAIVGFLAG